ncbi:MAG TPA: hypothetical protein VMH49_01235 [Thermoplasmata archaeon]|nr:hypothetical protein [Thermoplasmata archaeon]
MITLLWLYPGPVTPYGILGLGAYGLAFPVMVRRLGVPRTSAFVLFLLVVGVAFAVVSIPTGWANGLTDEAFTTPQFAGFLLSGHDPYTTPMVYAYVAYGRHFVSTSYYVYLPLLMFLQIPGVPYKWFGLASWVGLVLLVRRRFDVALVLAQPYVMLIGENGYNDVTVLLLLSVGFVGWAGRRQKWAEWLSLGCKQFANVFVLAYYAVRRDAKNFLLTAGITVAFVLPFVLWSGTAALCPTLVANRLPSCPHTGGIQLLVNYPVWAVWVAAVFYGPALVLVRRRVARWPTVGRRARWRVDPTRLERLPSVAVVVASAAVSGLAVFVVLEARTGGSFLGLTASGLAGALAAGAWFAAWGGPWDLGGTGSSVSRRAAFAATEGLLLVVSMGVLIAWSSVGGGAVSGMAVGLLAGTAAGASWAWVRRLFGPTSASRRTSPVPSG